MSKYSKRTSDIPKEGPANLHDVITHLTSKRMYRYELRGDTFCEALNKEELIGLCFIC